MRAGTVKMKKSRWAILAASAAMAALAGGATSVWAAPQGRTTAAAQPETPPATTQPAVVTQRPPAAALSATSPPNADPARTYAQPSDAILAADLDYLVRKAHTGIEHGEHTAIWPVLAYADELASNRLREARGVLEHAEGGLHGGLADLFE